MTDVSPAAATPGASATPPVAVAAAAAPVAAPAVFVQPPEYASDMALRTGVSNLLRADQGTMPEKVADALTAFGGAGDIQVLENYIEALYDWACLGDNCPDDARRVGYGGASLFSRYSYGVMGKTASADVPKRADGIRLELRRQMGDPSSTATEAERPAPQGVYVPAPVVQTITVTADEVAALLGAIKTAHAAGDARATQAAIDAAEAAFATAASKPETPAAASAASGLPAAAS
jgi:hypothetical protein